MEEKLSKSDKIFAVFLGSIILMVIIGTFLLTEQKKPIMVYKSTQAEIINTSELEKAILQAREKNLDGYIIINDSGKTVKFFSPREITAENDFIKSLGYTISTK